MVSIQRLEYLDLSFDLALLDRLERLDDDGLIIPSGDAGVDFGILALADLGDDLKLVDIAAWVGEYPYSIS